MYADANKVSVLCSYLRAVKKSDAMLELTGRDTDQFCTSVVSLLLLHVLLVICVFSGYNPLPVQITYVNTISL
ncbi:hypothetical protein AQUCO_01700033v1 [Aquilegia coerulea]|uniref:Uncharacterized protein n=1 Tax=Aquilegia coerulea TaxID=218851 RepID=A0A2G5DKV8_AQUCA|nr:hypothetical protein AQUCO_01700033v1 [Aquilegia coerulea]